MLYKPYGKTGRDVSMLGFGAMRLPMLEDGTCDFEKAVPMLKRGIDFGINYIDTARGYIKGTSEVAVGKAIKGYDREKLFVVTKIPSNEKEKSEAKAWREQLDEQLGRFDMPYLDLILFHGLSWQAFNDHVSKPGFALEAAKKAQTEGLVRHIGFSSHDTPENIQKLIGTGEFAGVLMQFNFLDTRNRNAIENAKEAGMGVTIMGPVAGGRLGVPGSVALEGESIESLKIPELALRFVWNTPGVTVALSGMNVMEHIDENVQAAEKAAGMSETERQQVSAIIEKNKNLMDLYCTGCGYCLPCPNGVNIPENFKYMNWYKVWGLEQQAKENYSKFSPEGFWAAGSVEGLSAAACVECGECEPKCPQNIPIIKQ
ncbi:MAG: aldo/keto reductase, partial [Spirochaetales bacterium]|nr:aldo/keto reductase [Spirochaetales bacterium]